MEGKKYWFASFIHNKNGKNCLCAVSPYVLTAHERMHRIHYTTYMRLVQKPPIEGYCTEAVGSTRSLAHGVKGKVTPVGEANACRRSRIGLAARIISCVMRPASLGGKEEHGDTPNREGAWEMPTSGAVSRTISNGYLQYLSFGQHQKGES